MEHSLHNSPPALQEANNHNTQEERIAEIEALANKDSVPNGFEVDTKGVWYRNHKKENEPNREWVCAPLWVTAYTRDHRSENHGRVLEFQDIDGHKHRWKMAMDLLGSEANKVISVLLNMGLRISPAKRSKDHLIEYLSMATPVRKARCVMQCGWFNNTFVLPSRSIGYAQGETIVYQNVSASDAKIGESGSLIEWKVQIAQKAIGNSRLTLAISAAFAAPLLCLVNHENIGIHYRGHSSLGKSTAGCVGNSVWASPADIHTFRATANGLEGIASLHNDRLLSLDELGQISPHEAGQVIYMLGNGMGKGRAAPQGFAKKQATWRLVFLSTGELSLAQLMAEIGKRTQAGQEVRFIEIPADTGRYGLFENLHNFESGAAFSTYLKETCAKQYGIAAKEFLTKLVEDLEGAVSIVKAIIEGIRQRYLPKTASAQVYRVFNHLALIAAAGELASQFGITGWDIEDASEGVMSCFSAWSAARGDLGMHEEKIALSQVKKFFSLHAESRFSPWIKEEGDKSRTNNRVGFRRQIGDEVEFYVFPEPFRDEICSGLDYRFVEQVCLKHQWLMPSSKGEPTRPERFPNMKSTKRCYRFKETVLTDQEEFNGSSNKN